MVECLAKPDEIPPAITSTEVITCVLQDAIDVFCGWVVEASQAVTFEVSTRHSSNIEGPDLRSSDALPMPFRGLQRGLQGLQRLQGLRAPEGSSA